MHREAAGVSLAQDRVRRGNEERRLPVVGALTVKVQIESQESIKLQGVSFADEIRPSELILLD
jgi:hypothetical protein